MPEADVELLPDGAEAPGAGGGDALPPPVPVPVGASPLPDASATCSAPGAAGFRPGGLGGADSVPLDRLTGAVPVFGAELVLGD